MAFTEKVSINGTTLSFLLYECINIKHSQEGFLIGNITSEITKHISDLRNDSARLDLTIEVNTVLPLPSVSLFYCSSGKLKEHVISEFLSHKSNEVVGWYKYRRHAGVKPTLRDKIVAKGLQKYFEKNHGVKNFVTCNVSNISSANGSTHTFSYQFGKINNDNEYECVEYVTNNLGEKITGYKQPIKYSNHSIFNKILKECYVSENSNSTLSDIQNLVNEQLSHEARIALKNFSKIRELEEDIKEMKEHLANEHTFRLQNAYKEVCDNNKVNKEKELVDICFEAMNSTSGDISLQEISAQLKQNNETSDLSQEKNKRNINATSERSHDVMKSFLITPSSSTMQSQCSIPMETNENSADLATELVPNLFDDDEEDLIKFDDEPSSQNYSQQ